jgi:hypothetical protein
MNPFDLSGATDYSNEFEFGRRQSFGSCGRLSDQYIEQFGSAGRSVKRDHDRIEQGRKGVVGDRRECG